MEDRSIAEERRPQLRTLSFITFGIVILDQLTKLLIKGVPFLGYHGVAYGSSRQLVDDIFRITYVENPGIAFGINIPQMKIFFSIFSIIASIGIFIYIKRNYY